MISEMCLYIIREERIAVFRMQTGILHLIMHLWFSAPDVGQLPLPY